SIHAAQAHHLVLSAPGTVVAGMPFDIAVEAQDAFNNVAVGYTGPLNVGTDDPQVTLPAPLTLSAGRGTLQVDALETTGTEHITFTDASNQTLNKSALIAVTPATVDHLVISAPVKATAGASFQVSIEARDAFGNLATGYTGPINLGTDDAQGL